ncbi:AAA family ATPase [Sphingomonas baiyangensis]|uniref:AAA domain-containing protein n=1 Tax=Sphingomonas baiyangensis TaxID=2572576 RepID=A0A4U1L576_9SPHN|nr:AAA family ATPase [Sphingomonas baiyangensis]TKD52059.1 hypothetical protein FBR43_15950 [Sphingomonas baiyangensis]
MTPYGEAALNAEVAAVRSIGSGGRNAQLNRSAFAVAQLVAGEQLDPDPARRALYDAANETGLDRKEIEATLASGWKAGLANPRYPYHDAGGRVLYAKTRLDRPKQKYGYEHPDGAGGWKPGRGDAEPVPYRLPDLIAAPKDAIIYMAEGEKQADKLASWGLVATSSKDWKGFEFARYVTGRTAVILPDNDPEGTRIAVAAKEAVERADGTALIVDLPGLPAKGDIMDWNGSADDLAALVKAAIDAPGDTFDIADLSAWAATAPTPKAFVMAPFIPRDEVVIITGDGGANKSTLALQISACAAAGRPMLGMDVAPGPALYVTAEDDQRENHWRLAKIADAIGTTLPALAGKLHVVSLRGRLNNELATFDGAGTLRATPAYAMLRATIKATGAKLVTLDNVAHLFAGNENDRGQVTAFINLLYRLCGDLGVTILLIAHRNKAGDSFSGSTAWLNAVRSQVLLERTDEHDPDARALSLGKANYARAGEPVAFRWHDFALVRDEDLPKSVRAEIESVARDSKVNSLFVELLDKTRDERRAVSASRAARNYAPRVFEAMTGAKGTKAAAFEAALERLLHLGEIVAEGRVFQRQNRQWVTGITRAEGAPTIAPTMHQPDAPERTNQHHQPAPCTHPISKDIPGAATRAAAPASWKVGTAGKRDLGVPIFAPGETGDEPVPGWDDFE